VTATVTGDFETIILTADLTITPAAIEGVTFEDAVFTFDETEKTVLITGEIPAGCSVEYENNTRTETAFIVPHMRDKKGGPERITDMRDIYENNANMGARRVRECIFAVLPKWFTDEAADRCRRTLETGGGKPLPQRRADLLTAFEPLGITKAMIERREGASVDALNETQIANLGIAYKSIKNGELSKDEAFPETAADEVTKALEAKATKKADETPTPTP